MKVNRLALAATTALSHEHIGNSSTGAQGNR